MTKHNRKKKDDGRSGRSQGGSRPGSGRPEAPTSERFPRPPGVQGRIGDAAKPVVKQAPELIRKGEPKRQRVGDRDALTPPTRGSLRDHILAFMRSDAYHPMDKVDMSKALHIHSSDRRSIRDVLRDLEQEGLIARIRKDRYVLPQTANLVTGKIEVHRNGNAHVLPETPGQREVFISAANLGIAMHGDKVVAQVRHEGREQARVADRLEGRVIRILERATDRVVGLLQESARQTYFVVPDDSRMPHNVYVRPGAVRLATVPHVGDKVVVKLAPWEDPRVSPEGEIIEVLGPAHAPGVDMLAIMRKYDLPQQFPPAVLTEAERISEEIHPDELANREDLRARMIITIDPDDARDFDDAIEVEPIRARNGEVTGWHLSVHIADVSHYVQPGSALDVEAKKRGNSTYLADRVVPMLPERLSNGICSLKPHVDRLTCSAFIEFTKGGKVKSARFSKTVIRSAARLSYRQAFAVLQGRDFVPPLPPSMEREARGLATLAEGPPVAIDPAVGQAVRTAWELASVLRKNRFDNGSLDLDFPEVKVWLDENGKAVKLERQDNDISHQLIEECMLAANEAVAKELKDRLVPTVYRVHADPDAERLADFREQAAAYGIKAGDLTQRREVQKVLAAMKGTPEEYPLKLQFLKSLKRAEYDINPIGHYGLAKENYTHFTSPIRRYADLVVHRSLERAIGLVTTEAERERPGRGPRRAIKAGASMGDMKAVADHISATERVSTDAERDSVMLKKIEYFLRQLTMKKPDEFRAIVVDVRSYGLLVELPDVLITGMIHVSALPEDFYIFDPVRLTFTGRKSKQRYKAGDEFPVAVARVDAYKRQIDFAPRRSK
jgi:ribonuclease R